MNNGWRLRMIALCAAVLGLLVTIDGLLNGPWYRFVGGLAWFVAWGWLGILGPPQFVRDRVTAFKARLAGESGAMKRPDGSRSWPLIFASVVFALIALAGAAFILFAPYQDLLDWSKRSAYLLHGLRDVLGEFGSRLPLAAVFLVAAYAASKTAWERFKD
ncbi:hypothetical protein BWI17_10590 [Betaproteobacteria bacterium GR16-43]|nr:hypothetical protein BWI17_10590 [Betaproteobacteria bacterium GR16-43]